MVRDSVRRFVRERYLPRAGQLFEKEKFPIDLIPEIAEMGLLGAGLKGYGCAGMSAGAVRADPAGARVRRQRAAQLRQRAGLARDVRRSGPTATRQQKQKYLPKMAKAELIGCFGLTEPDSGSDPGSMTTRARKDGEDWVLTGTKMWITNSPLAHLAVVWAKVDDGGAESIRGFIVERGTKGFETPRIHGKMSLRASETGEIVLDECRVPAENMLPNGLGLKAPLGCLTQARFGIAWGALGAAKACFESHRRLRAQPRPVRRAHREQAAHPGAVRRDGAPRSSRATSSRSTSGA